MINTALTPSNYGAYPISLNIKALDRTADNVKGIELQDDNIMQNSKIFGDLIEIHNSNSQPENISEKEAPEIGMGRIFLGRLTKEQIEAINESGKLPKNAKFKKNVNGSISITWNLKDITSGTHKLPAGYEVKNDIFGFTHVVLEGTKNIFIK